MALGMLGVLGVLGALASVPTVPAVPALAAVPVSLSTFGSCGGTTGPANTGAGGAGGAGDGSLELRMPDCKGMLGPTSGAGDAGRGGGGSCGGAGIFDVIYACSTAAVPQGDAHRSVLSTFGSYGGTTRPANTDIGGAEDAGAAGWLVLGMLDFEGMTS
ncbi:hypothetical protein QBC39DRAFT_366954 [Podospora conica]|nr:hypothetical protein QBC39DRAFT_366954 [Schizothecium conicum]